MLRPATPLSILLFASFILLLISTISTPIVKGIPIATFSGVNFGVFGYCKGSTDCSKLRVGYSTDGLFGTTASNNDFDLPTSSRHSLSSLLVVHPVAAFLNLICLGLAIAAHFHSPAHSARFLLGLLILLLPTLLVTLLAFLVDILLFVPHLAWGGWIVLGSTILITISGVVTCAMRRTLVSRKAQKKRIAENAEMSGENYYSRQDTEPKFTTPSITTEPRVPLVNGAPGADKLPTFATFEGARRTSDEERRPLNQQSPADGAPSSTLVDGRDNGSDRYGPPRSRSRGRYEGPRDEFGNPLPSSGAFAAPMPSRPSQDQYRNDRMGTPPSRGSFGSDRSRGGYQPRGRGGYGPPRGGYPGPRGPPPQGYMGRGGYPGEGRGGFNPRGRGGYPMAPMAAGASLGMAGGTMAGRQQRGPPPTYPPSGQYGSAEGDITPPNVYDEASQSAPYAAYGPNQPSPRNHSPGVGLRNPSPHSARQQSPIAGYRNPSPPPPLPMGARGLPPLGQAVEMDASGGRHNRPPMGYAAPNEQLRGSDADVQGMVGLQQNREAYGSNQQNATSPSSEYGPEEYIPPRREWNRGPGDNQSFTGSNRGPIAHNQVTVTPPVELPTASSSVLGPYRPTRRPRVSSGGSDYYEDVNPQFAPETEPIPPVPHNAALAPSYSPGAEHGMHDAIAPTASYEDLQQGSRSPVESETSEFTSVSQRGVNPNWRPGGPGDNMGQYGPPAMRKPVQVQQKRNVLLEGNPDFELPMSRPARGRGGMRRGGGRPIGPSGMSTVSGPSGRYPGADF